MIRGRSDLPLDSDASSRYLPWLIAFMVYLASLALAGALVIDELVGKWRANTTNTLTVQIPPPVDAGNGDRGVEKVLKILSEDARVIRAREIADDEMRILLEPWLGATADSDLPLPRLIDVELSETDAAAAQALEERLRRIVPGLTVEDHGLWLTRLVRLTRAVQWLAGVILAFIGAATIGTVVFTTRAGLSVHHKVIEVLHLIGAQDDYIAREFGRHAMAMALKGGFIGLVLVIPTLLGISYLTGKLNAVVVPAVTLDWTQWALVALLPVPAALVARLTAWTTVRRELKRML